MVHKDGRMATSAKTRLLVYGSLALLFASSAYVGITLWRSSPDAPTARDAARDAISGQFSLIDHRGKSVTEEDYNGKWRLVFFGFTYCPDVCPTTLSTVGEVLQELGPLASEIYPLFITVDPERDTPEVMADYVANFDPRIIGLTGSPKQLEKATESYRVYYAKVPDANEADGYTMDHTAYLYLMNRQGDFETVLRHEEKPEIVVTKLKEVLSKSALAQ